MLDYDLGEMRDINGSSLRYEVEARSSEYAVGISRRIEATSVYKKLYKRMPGKLLLLYFRLIIRNSIRPYVLQGCVIQWYKRNDKPLPAGKDCVLIPKIGILGELAKCWDFMDIPIKLVNPLSLRALCDTSCRTLLRKIIRSYAKSHVGEIVKRVDGFKRKNFSVQPSKEQTIACHYAEGIDSSRRNDLNWYIGSGIKPEQVLIYFDGVYAKTGKPVKGDVIRQIEKFGFRWASLKRNIIENQGSNYWVAPGLPRGSLIKKPKGHNAVEKWVAQVGNDLLRQVQYWRSFYNEFNVEINYVSEEGSAKNMAQAIAFDINKEKARIIVGKQRSEIFIDNLSIAHYPRHIFFTWNRRARHYLNPNHEHIEINVISGYPNNFLEKDRDHSLGLKNKGVKFTIALFDNMHGPDNYFSTKKMRGFYTSFLQWFLDDAELGLVIKSKKPYLINSLHLVYPLLKRALDTGRCIRLDDEWGRFPSDASFGADMAVGVGISSALIESVIAGCRGVLYDITNLKKHEFYRWGYETVIFNELNKMISAMKRYKKDRRSEPGFGDWSLHLDDLDPFRDGKGGQRMGVYMHWLLESFNEGKSHDAAIEYANRLYKEKWGEDKIVDMRYRNESD